jgi:uncharacterized protein (TIRG00374 family)
VRSVDFNQFLPVLASSNLFLLGLALLTVILTLGLKIWRWKILLNNFGLTPSWGSISRAYLAGQAANILLPMRGGDVVRLGYVIPQKAERAAEWVTSVVVEKYVDLVLLALMLAVMSTHLPVGLLGQSDNHYIYSAVLATLVVLMVLVSGPKVWLWVRKCLGENSSGWREKLGDLVERWFEASRWLRSPSRFLPLIGLSLLIWGIMWSTNVLVLSALGAPEPIWAGLATLLVVYVALVPALMPGNIGPFYFFAGLALAPYGAAEQTRLAFVVWLHALVTLPPLVAGGLVLLFSKGGKYV